MTDVQSRIAALSPQQRALLEPRAARLVSARRPVDDAQIPPRDRSRPTPLAFAQQREWALERFRPSNNIIGAMRIDGELDLDRLAAVITEITARHEVLRSTIVIVDGTPTQVVEPVTPVPLPVVDLSALTPVEQEVEVRRCYQAEVTRPFPHDQATKFRATVLRLAPQVHIGLLIMHHAASDGWSASIVIKEAVELYQASLLGRAASLPPPVIQYGDFAVWQRERMAGEQAAKQMDYWRETLADMPPRLELPTDRPHPAHRTFAGDQVVVQMPEDVTVPLRRFAETEGVSIAMLMVAAVTVVLHRYTGQEDLVLGSAVTGRNRTETEELIGCFANALPLRMRMAGCTTMRDVLAQARDVVSGAFTNQDVPFDRLIDELAPREASPTPLIQMMVNVLTMPGEISRPVTDDMKAASLTVRPVTVELGPVPIDLILFVQPHPSAMMLQWHYSTELFDRATVERLAHHVRLVLDRIVADPGCRIQSVELPAAARPDDVPVPVTRGAGAVAGVVERFRRRVEAAPDDPAVVCDGAATTYADLDERTDRLARRLRALGAGPEATVGVLVERSPLLAEAVLGVLKSGAAYVPLDPGLPAERVRAILVDAGATLLVTSTELAGALPEDGRRAVLVDEEATSGAEEAVPEPLPVPGPGSAAYVVYTSGSTGTPKGVVVEHRSLVCFAEEVAARLGLGVADRMLQFASPGFDVLAEELFPIWLAGGAVVFPPPGQAGPALDLSATIEQERVTLVELPAAYWHEWVRLHHRTGRPLPQSLRLVIIGSERALPDRLAMWQQLGVPLVNVYGLTETTVSSTFFRLRRDAAPPDLHRLPIGTPLPSVDVRLLDPDLQAVPEGGIGELYLGGVGVARGYRGDHALTAARYVADPAGGGARLYRTGDLARRRADGNLEFLSRADAQIKIRGFRVEPAEIETALCRHPQVAQAVVTADDQGDGQRRLVAHVVPEPRTRVNITDLRRFLGRELPHYLVPAAFVQLEQLPVTDNGKIDHALLPAPTEDRPELPTELVAPRTAAEQRLADLVAEVLGITAVGAHDNFFELGGDSIQAIQVASQAQEHGFPLSPLDLFERPTVAQLAEVAGRGAATDGRGSADAAVTPDRAEDPTPDDFPLARVDQSQLDVLFGGEGTVAS
jgi:amino acid adenylation domain-containing protein